MRKVDLIIDFSKEFFLDHNFSEISENLVLSLKEDVLASISQVSAELADYFRDYPLSKDRKHRFAQLNRILQSDFEKIQQIFSKKRKSRLNFLTNSCSSQKEHNSSFESLIDPSFNQLKNLLRELEGQAKACHPVEPPPLANDDQSHSHLYLTCPLSFYQSLISNYSQLHKTFTNQIGEKDLPDSARPVLSAVQLHLNEVQHNAEFQFIRKKISATNKLLKIMNDIASICLSLYGDKIITNRKTDASPKIRSLFDESSDLEKDETEPHDSLAFPHQISKVGFQRSSGNPDSLYLNINDVLKKDEHDPYRSFFEDTLSIKKLDELSFERKEKSKLSGKDDHDVADKQMFVGKCICAIF